MQGKPKNDENCSGNLRRSKQSMLPKSYDGCNSSQSNKVRIDACYLKWIESNPLRIERKKRVHFSPNLWAACEFTSTINPPHKCGCVA